MFENYVDVIEASKILDVHPETVKRLIREGKLTATKFGNNLLAALDKSPRDTSITPSID